MKTGKRRKRTESLLPLEKVDFARISGQKTEEDKLRNETSESFAIWRSRQERIKKKPPYFRGAYGREFKYKNKRPHTFLKYCSLFIVL